MHHGSGLILASALLVGGVVTLASQGIGRFYPLIRPGLDKLSPADRSRCHHFLAVLPWAAAFSILLMAFLPSMVRIPGWIEDHCLTHPGYPHLCLTHGFWVVSVQAWLILGFLCLGAGYFWFCVARRLWEGQRCGRALLKSTRLMGNVHVLPTNRALALSTGLWCPRTLVSTEIFNKLPPGDLAVVLAHEAAHAKRRDALHQALIEFLMAAAPKRSREHLMEDFSLACEELCDRRAVSDTGSTVQVAEVILKVQRLGAVRLEGLPGATGSHLIRRVRGLLEDAYPPTPWWMRCVWLSPLLLLASVPAHHFAEKLAGFFFR